MGANKTISSGSPGTQGEERQVNVPRGGCRRLEPLLLDRSVTRRSSSVAGCPVPVASVPSCSLIELGRLASLHLELLRPTLELLLRLRLLVLGGANVVTEPSQLNAFWSEPALRVMS